MAHPLDGISERLKRAEENIVNLDANIKRFMDASPHRSVSDRNHGALKEFHEFWAQQRIPGSFGVLISEIAHHYRSALDNLVWQLATTGGRIPSKPDRIEFPIFEDRPNTTEKIKFFHGKIEGVCDSAKAIIESLQPYHRIPNGPNYFLLALHDMNRFDKHRELIFTETRIDTKPALYLIQAERIRKSKDGTVISSTPIGEPRMVAMGSTLSVQVEFKKFRNQGRWAVIPALRKLKESVEGAIGRFESFFPPR
jgi:hypothetical protein